MSKPPKRAAKKTAASTETPAEPAATTADRTGKKTVAKAASKKIAAKKAVGKKTGPKKSIAKTVAPKRNAAKKSSMKKTVRRAVRSGGAAVRTATLDGATAGVLDRLFEVVTLRRDADPNISHSARLLSRGTAKVAQKFGEEAVECLIEAVAGNSAKLIGESADVLYHLIVMWVDAGVNPNEIWAELQRREGTSGIAEKLGRGTRPAGE